ncbi:phage minor head protein [Pseudochelatococcus contaminans]|uniref:SPP1 gp7 family putative phage head morphogenesis protein n=1 Tax=Pseudochelatococcus contaminans TaxID=1538103 RepID=A0A7W5Z2A6_9HYPH|nr:SPP1 gp7 family putative phage head morphogenesis protein [Pseudochelatococcus contaminans]
MTIDRAPQSSKSAWRASRRIENEYAQKLRGVARAVDVIVSGFDAGNPAQIPAIEGALTRYSGTIGGWAESVARRMVLEVEAHDKRRWMQVSRKMGRALRHEIANAPTGEVMRARMAEQVRLITSLPSEAAQRVHDLTIEGITQGTRASEIAKKIMEAGDVTASRANMIARTEVSRTATLLTQARAEYVGSDGYIWRTSGDSDVRPSHKAMNGKFVRWSELPELDGMVGHAGALPNCRCYPEPVIPDD